MDNNVVILGGRNFFRQQQEKLGAIEEYFEKLGEIEYGVEKLKLK